MSEDSILLEAHDVVRGDRQAVYGSPAEDFARTAAIWSALKPGVQFTALDVAYFMVALKLSRLVASPLHRDSLVDIAGYADCADQIAAQNRSVPLLDVLKGT